MANHYSCRPSQLLGLSEPDLWWEAYCLDEAVMILGNHIEKLMSDAEGRIKDDRQRNQARLTALKTFLAKDSLGAEPPKGAFADPAEFMHKMKKR